MNNNLSTFFRTWALPRSRQSWTLPRHVGHQLSDYARRLPAHPGRYSGISGRYYLSRPDADVRLDDSGSHMLNLYRTPDSTKCAGPNQRVDYDSDAATANGPRSFTASVLSEGDRSGGSVRRAGATLLDAVLRRLCGSFKVRGFEKRRSQVRCHAHENDIRGCWRETDLHSVGLCVMRIWNSLWCPCKIMCIFISV